MARKAKPQPLSAKPLEQEEREEYAFWLGEIKRARKQYERYFEQVRQIEKLYKDDRPVLPDGMPTQHRMNILWSNVQVLQPSIYSRTPMPNVSRRFLNKDPASRTAALIAERNLMTAVELCDFDYPMKRVRDDYLLGGRGIPWVKYKPEFGMVNLKEPVTQDDRGGYRSVKGVFVANDKVKHDDEIGHYYDEPTEQVLTYGLEVEHVVNSDFLHEPVNDWTKIGWIARKHLMKRAELVREFKQLGRDCTLNKSSTSDGEEREKGKADCAEVWQVWAKGKRKVIYLSDSLPDRLLRKTGDPLRLSSFWPCPRPLLGTTTTSSLIPVPDYALYQDQAAQIDKLTDRIRVLTQALRVVGVYNAQSESLKTLLDEATENEMVPVDNWVWFSGTGGIKGNVDWFPIEQISAVLQALFQARSQLRNDLYEVTGISDIIRGVSDPNATATAEQIKSNFGSLRLQDKQSEMARVARDTLRIMAEIQCEHYPGEALIEMSGIAESDEFLIRQDDPQAAEKQAKAQAQLQSAVQILKDDKLRTFKIDIETDATVAPDQQKEKESRVEFLTSVAPYIEKAAQVGAQAPQLVPLLMKMLDYGVRGFRTGRTLESAIDQTIEVAEKMVQDSQNPQGQNDQPPDPAAEAQAAEFQAKAEKAKLELSEAQAKAQLTQQENSKRLIDMQANAEQQRIKVALEVENLKASLANKQADNERNRILFEKEVRLKELQLTQMQGRDAIGELQGLIGSTNEQPQVDPAELQAREDEALAKRLSAEAALIEAQAKLAAVQQQANGIGALTQALGEGGLK